MSAYDPSDPPYRLTHQTLVILEASFEQRRLYGYVELRLTACHFPLTKVVLNCRHARLYRVTVNNHRNVDFDYRDPTLLVCPDDIKQRNLDYFCGAYMQAVAATNFELGNGELCVNFSNDIQSEINRKRHFTLRIEFSLESPDAGVHFVVPPAKDPGQSLYARGAHLFTYTYENCNKLWFPHIDSPLMPCMWRIELNVPADLIGISSGELVDTILNEETNMKTFVYNLSVPTSANRIGIVIGAFEIHPDPDMFEMTHFCPPGLGEVLSWTVTPPIHEMVEFLEQLLGNRFPFGCYKTVFVDEAYRDCISYSSLSVFSVNLLHSHRVIDQVPATIKLFAGSVAEQLFGCFISMASWSDSWTVYGIARHLAAQFTKETFGNNEYEHQLKQLTREVCDYEEAQGEIILDNSIALSNNYKSNNVNACKLSPNLMSPSYIHIIKQKAHLVVRLISQRIGPAILIQVFNKMVSLAVGACKQQPETWSGCMAISTNSLINSVGTLCGKDLTDLIKMWVFQGGHPLFHIAFDFNRKRNCIELEIKQQEVSASRKGLFRYVGPLTLYMQELDGPFTHDLNIEELNSRHDIACHSKSRRQKKKKIPMKSGEEIDMNLHNLDQDLPVLWIRIDPENQLICKVKLEMQDVAWQLMLKYEKNAIAQMDSVIALRKYESHESRQSLIQTVENSQIFYRVRIAAINSLVTIATKCYSKWSGMQTLIDIGKQLFGSNACPDIVRSNDFTNLQDYFMLKAYPLALSKLRNAQNFCPEDILRLILDLSKYNDNRKNAYSDSHYKANIIDALSQSIVPAATLVSSPDMLSNEMKTVVEEVVRYLNLEKLLPSYKLCVTVSCIKAVRNLQRNGHLPNDPMPFKSYCSRTQFLDVRLAAIEALVDFTRDDANSFILSFLMDIIETDPVPYVRHRTLQMMAASPPFCRQDNNPLNTEATVNRLWNLMNRVTVGDARLRCSAIEFYHALYGRNRPYCLPAPELGVVVNLREKRAEVTRGEKMKPAADPDSSIDTSIDSLNITIEDLSVPKSRRIDDNRLSFCSTDGMDIKQSPTDEEMQDMEVGLMSGVSHSPGSAQIECVPDEQFQAARHPMYLPDFPSQDSGNKGKKKKTKKEKKKKKSSKRARGELDFASLSSASSSRGGFQESNTVNLSPPSSPGSMSD